MRQRMEFHCPNNSQPQTDDPTNSTVKKSPQRERGMFASSFEILLLLPLGLTSGLQQVPSASTDCVRRPISFHQQSTSLWSASLDAADVTSDLLSTEDNRIIKSAYDWDEQFEELRSFKAKYGHCNFPQNPSEELKQKYPMLKEFCSDQRVEYVKVRINRRGGRRKNLRVFDREVCCHRLEEIGFEFNPTFAKWYDHYHELLQYFSANGHSRIKFGGKYVMLGEWARTQRKRRSKLTESQIKLLDDIAFEWELESYDEQWNTKYKELVAFRNTHGHLNVEHSDSLYKWMCNQRARGAGRKGHRNLTEIQRRLLDEIEFPWKGERILSRWYAMYDELQRFQKEHGHCQPDQTKHKKLYKWSRDQRSKHRRGFLSTEQLKLLEKLGFTLEGNPKQWSRMYDELTEYSNTHGHLQVNQDDDPVLYDWMTMQRKLYHGIVKKQVMSDQQIEKLEEIHFCWSLDWRERTWHEKYTEVVEFFKEHGHVMVTKKENLILYNWIQAQGKRYKELEGQKPFSEEELEMLEQIDFPFFDGQPRMAWDRMYAKVVGYLDENDGRFPTSHKDDPDLNRWMRQQRHRYRRAYGYAPLSDKQTSLLKSIDFLMYPEGKILRNWYESYDELFDFWKQHGHFLVDRSKYVALDEWLRNQRMRLNCTSVKSRPFSKMQKYLLERIGFTWTSDRFETQWQTNYEEVVKFLEVQGHFPRVSENLKLVRWMTKQRQNRKGNGVTQAELTEDQIQKLDKIGFRWL